MIRNNRCPYCGKYFNWKGIARHEAMHRNKIRKISEERAREDSKYETAREESSER